MSVAGYVKRLTQLSAYGTCTAVRNALGCQPGGIIFTERTVNLRLWGVCFILRLVGAFMSSNFCENFGCATRRGVANFTLWTATSVYWLGAVGVECRIRIVLHRGAGNGGVTFGYKERGGPHTQRPTPHVPGTVISAASHRYPEFHGRCRRDEESSTTLWCLSARLSR